MKIENRIDANLKPDYYDLFPSYTREEMLSRISDMPFHLATLLSPKNIRKILDVEECQNEFITFLDRDLSEQRSCLCEVLDYRGFSTRVIKSMGKVRREQFLPEKYQKYSYLDMSIPFTKYSVISNPSIVALMIDMLDVQPGHKVLEIGVGSGYHASCLIESLEGDCEFVGVEINPAFYKFGAEAIRATGYPNISTLLGSEEILLDGSHHKYFNRIYSASSLEQIPDHIASLIANEGIFQATRPLTRYEYEMEKPSAWLRKQFADYDSYLLGDWRQLFACLTIWQFQEIQFQEVNTVYDVAFVPYRTNLLLDDIYVDKELFPELYP